MKKVLFAVVFLIGTTVSFAQDRNTAVCGTKIALTQGKDAGKILVKLPADVTAEDVQTYAAYYEKTFTVNFNAQSHEVTFNMISNDSNSRRIIIRFLSANQIQNVIVENRVYTITDFYENFLK